MISLENIYRHLEMGALPRIAAEVGGAEVNLAVLAATLVDVVDFLPVVFLYGASKFLFSSLALAFCLSLPASFVVAMTVIPLFCSRFLKQVPHAEGHVAAPGAPPDADAAPTLSSSEPTSEKPLGASPSAPRKGSAFPPPDPHNQSPLRRLEGPAFGRRILDKILVCRRKGQALPHSSGQSPAEAHASSSMGTGKSARDVGPNSVRPGASAAGPSNVSSWAYRFNA